MLPEAADIIAGADAAREDARSLLLVGSQVKSPVLISLEVTYVQ